LLTEYIEIPSSRLSEDVLQAVIEEYVCREGTDYGLSTYTLEKKVLQVMQQLEKGTAIIVFDPVSESCSVLLK
jgi:uncharacterized protein YheU (UPF0270 family)